jgi:hypothetical protein
VVAQAKSKHRLQRRQFPIDGGARGFLSLPLVDVLVQKIMRQVSGWHLSKNGLEMK